MIYGRERGHLRPNLRPVRRSKVIELLSDSPSSQFSSGRSSGRLLVFNWKSSVPWPYSLAGTTFSDVAPA